MPAFFHPFSPLPDDCRPRAQAEKNIEKIE
jgi:hypothetical protein